MSKTKPKGFYRKCPVCGLLCGRGKDNRFPVHGEYDGYFKPCEGMKLKWYKEDKCPTKQNSHTSP